MIVESLIRKFVKLIWDNIMSIISLFHQKVYEPINYTRSIKIPILLVFIGCYDLIDALIKKIMEPF